MRPSRRFRKGFVILLVMLFGPTLLSLLRSGLLSASWVSQIAVRILLTPFQLSVNGISICKEEQEAILLVLNHQTPSFSTTHTKVLTKKQGESVGHTQ